MRLPSKILGIERHHFRSLIAVTRGYWWSAPVLIGLGVLSALTEGLGIGLMIPLFAAIFGQGEEGGRIGEIAGRVAYGLSESERVALLIGLILLLAGVRAAVLFAYDAIAVRIVGRITHRLRMVLFRQLLDVGYAYFATRDRGRLFDILRRETWLAGELLMSVSKMLSSLCTIVVFSALLLVISPALTLAGALGAAVIALVVRFVAHRMHHLGAATVAPGALLSRRAMEVIASMRTIRLFGQEQAALDRFEHASEGDRVAAERVDMGRAMIQPLTELLYAPLFLGILLGAWASGMSFATLVGYMVLLYRLQPHARRLDHLRVELAGQIPVVEHILALMRRDDKPYLPNGTRPFRTLRRGIRFEEVGFSYGEDGEVKQAISDVSLEIRKNRVTAIVGESGSGKSTVVNLLFRLHDPLVGRITVDGVSLTELDLADWRSRLAFSGQDTELIGDTIMEAVCFGRPEATRQEAEEAAHAAHATDFIENLPQGWDTPIGDGGLRLSAGQRQRIALARALLCEPEILVLDEATSALDSFSESLVQDALKRLSGKTTMLVIAHRLSTIRDADHVVVMQAGRIIEHGEPRDLLRQEAGAFSRLWRLQSEAFDASA
ncbi:ABC transporter ATP-binding protein [Falsiroseomonas sp.]|uniref:ABC transporter ATP-binding protein n=1 Tax=Falsiroseomonas sp. TaxID=2870721 RepID=UPI003563221A